MDEPVQEQQSVLPEPKQQTSPFSRLPIILSILGIVIAGVYIGSLFSNKNTSQIQTATNIVNTPTTRPTRIPEPTPTIRPTDPVVNGKKLYSVPNSGLTFQYPIELEIFDEYIGPAAYQSKYEIDILIGKPENKKTNLYDFHVHKNRFDGAGSNTVELYKESILVGDTISELHLYNECDWEKTCSQIDRAYAYISFERKGEFWEFDFNNIHTKDVKTNEDSKKLLTLFKEIISTVRFTD